MKSSSNLFFQFRHVYSTLIDSQKELLEQRERSIAQLKQSTKEVKSLKIKFCTDLRLIDEELSEVHSQSKDLSESCSKLSVDFTQITDRLDVATSLVRKADTISTYIQNIQIFGSDSDLDSVLTKLKNTTFPLNDQFKTAEYLSKLIKIIDISEKKANIECARINLESYRTRLSQELLRTFKDKLTSAHSTPEELHNYARSLSYLQLGHETIRAYIDMSPVFSF
ncbi:uncharacterized protein GO595_010313 [Histomonas meleagridis]|uniref:uncharacterized protein n=1 Tax=Histomonas meleagridis TaxID=135588 RepID=UPI0035598348|nr:hypothetical protein GO595_010313 [Histomonas meleagridis]